MISLEPVKRTDKTDEQIDKITDFMMKGSVMLSHRPDIFND